MADERYGQTKAGGRNGRGAARTIASWPGEIEANPLRRAAAGQPAAAAARPRQERSVNVSTVTRAYRELQNLNLVIGSTRRGTIVTSEGAMPRVIGRDAGWRDRPHRQPPRRRFSRAAGRGPAPAASDKRFRECRNIQPPEGPAWARARKRWIALNGFEQVEDIVVTSGARVLRLR